jgi:hypothetical protein
MIYTTRPVNVSLGIFPASKKTVIQHHVFKGGEYYGRADSAEDAEKLVKSLNADEAAYQAQIKASGLLEWEFLNQNDAG